MAVGDHVFDGHEPPPLLVKALNYQRWGIGDINRLAPGLLAKINTCLNYYNAISGYRSAKKVTSWAQNNPQAHGLVTWYISQRKVKHGNSNQ